MQKLHARTKIVATLGPASGTEEQIAQLLKAGVDVFRINMAHGSREDHNAYVDRIRSVSERLKTPVGILIDLAGPKIRLETLQCDPTECKLDEEYRFVRSGGPLEEKDLTCNYEPLVDELKVGDRIVLADGAAAMEVIGKDDDSVTCRVTEAGAIRSRQGVNLPGVALSAPSMTSVDRDNARWAALQGVDFVGLSFVRSPQDVIELKSMLTGEGATAMVVAKIEKSEALEQLDAIVDAADAVMVARGDLGVEIDVAETPVAQKRIVATCRRYRKPVIVATQMLDSMQHSRRPTRAEATDVANAILDGADACMLSGETAVGEYPIDAVKMMNRIMTHTETLLEQAPRMPPPDRREMLVHPITAAVVFGAGRIAERLGAKLVVIVTKSGQTARVKAKQRDYIPTIGVSASIATLRQMTLFWGIIPLVGAPVEEGAALRKFIDDWARERDLVESGDSIVFVTGTGLVKNAHNAIIIHETS